MNFSPLSNVLKDKIKGCIYGQAIGDALGLGTEFMTQCDIKKFYPDGLKYYDQIIQDRHRSRWKKGAWTDDTEMMICIANARENNHFNLKKIAQNFKDWFNGTPLGIGRHTFNVLCVDDYTEDPIRIANLIWSMWRRSSAANGGLMRTSIVGTSNVVTESEIADICRLTHPDMRCVGSCVITVRLIQNLIFNNVELSKSEILEIADRYDDRIAEYVEFATNDDTSAMSLDDNTMGYTLKTLGVALWSLWHCNSFEEGLLKVVNLGGDADTNAAVACAILGAKYGFSQIPPYYAENLSNKQILENIYTTAITDLENQTTIA